MSWSFWVLLVLIEIYYFLGFGLLLKFRREDSIQKRHLLLILISGAFSLLSAHFLLLRQPELRCNDFPCEVRSNSSVLPCYIELWGFYTLLLSGFGWLFFRCAALSCLYKVGYALWKDTMGITDNKFQLNRLEKWFAKITRFQKGISEATDNDRKRAILQMVVEAEEMFNKGSRQASVVVSTKTANGDPNPPSFQPSLTRFDERVSFDIPSTDTQEKVIEKPIDPVEKSLGKMHKKEDEDSVDGVAVPPSATKSEKSSTSQLTTAPVIKEASDPKRTGNPPDIHSNMMVEAARYSMPTLHPDLRNSNRLISYGALRFSVIYISAIIVIIAIIQVSNGINFEVMKCPNQLSTWLPLYLMTIFILGALPILLFYIRKVDDSYGIRLDLGLEAVFYFIGLIMFGFFLAFSLQDKYGNYALLIINIIIFFLISYIPSYRCWQFQTHCRQLDLTHSSLLKVLHTPQLRQELHRVSIKLFCVEITLFYEEYLRALENEQSQGGGVTACSSGLNSPEAGYLYQKYIRQNSPCELNLPYEVRKPLMDAFENNKLTMVHLEQVRREVFLMIFENSFPELIRIRGNINLSCKSTQSLEKL